jgi:hypothetical protein
LEGPLFLAKSGSSQAVQVLIPNFVNNLYRQPVSHAAKYFYTIEIYQVNFVGLEIASAHTGVKYMTGPATATNRMISARAGFGHVTMKKIRK